MGGTPTILYHYTSLDAFRKIMESGTVRATHYSELNDWSEIERGRKIVLRSLRAQSASIKPGTMAFLRRQAAKFGKGDRQIFIFSLSKVPDSLDQWRAYCQDGGVAIGFTGEGIDGHFRKASTVTTTTGWATPAWKLTKCQYPEDGEFLDVREMVSNADEIIRSQNGLTAGIRIAYSYTLLERTCCSIKHPAYNSEEEWRCFRTLRQDEHEKVQLSERNTRFVEISFVAREVIKSVVISPHGDTRQGRTLAQYFKHSKSLGYDIAESQIPFRRM